MASMDVIKEILVEKLELDEAKLTDDATFDSLGIDSLDLVELICDIEDRLGVDFGDPEGLQTLGDVAKYVDGLSA